MKKQLLFYFAIFLIFFGCELPEKPSFIAWDVNFNIPIAKDTLTVRDIIKDNENLYFSGDSVFVTYSDTLNNQNINEELNIGGNNENFNLQLDNFTVESPEEVNAQLKLRELWDDADTYNGQTIPLPSLDLPERTKNLDLFSTFQFIHIHSGQLKVTFKNNLGFKIRNIRLKVLNRQNGQLIGEFIHEQIVNNGEEVIKYINVAGKTLENSIDVKIQISTAGGENVLINSNNTLNVKLRIDDQIIIDSARMKFASTKRKDVYNIYPQSEHQLVRLKVRNGKLKINLSNNFDFNLTNAKIKFKNLFDADLDTVIIPFQMYAGQTNYLITRDLDNYTLIPSANNKLEFEVEYTINTDDNYVDINSQNKIYGNLELTDIKVDYFEGVLSPTVVEIKEGFSGIDVPVNIQGLNVVNPILKLKLDNHIAFNGSFNLTVTGINTDNGQTASANFTGNFHPGINEYVFTNTTSGLANIMNLYPDSIKVSGNLTVAGYGVVHYNDYVGIQVKFESLLQVSLTHDAVLEREVQLLDLTPDDKKQINKVNKAKFVLNVVNHFPMNCSFAVYFSRNENTILTNPEGIIGPINISAGETNSGGWVINPIASELVVDIGRNIIDLLIQDKMYYKVMITLPNGNGNILTLSANDYLGWSGMITIDTHINTDDFKK